MKHTTPWCYLPFTVVYRINHREGCNVVRYRAVEEDKEENKVSGTFVDNCDVKLD